MSYLDTIVPIFPSYASRSPMQGRLGDFLYDPSGKDRAAEVMEMKEKADRDYAKALLPAAMVSCTCKSRDKEAIKTSTRLICLDIDAKDNPGITDWAAFILNWLSKIQYITFAGRSISGHGAFAIIPVSTDGHLSHFKALQEDFSRCGVIIDPSGKDLTRLRGYAYNDDSTSFHNSGAKQYERCLYTPPPKPFKKPSGNDVLKVQSAVNAILAQKKDVTADYGNWIKIGQALSIAFGEGGRQWWHQVSQFHPEYDYQFADKKYSSFFDKGYNQISLGTFFMLCK